MGRDTFAEGGILAGMEEPEGVRLLAFSEHVIASYAASRQTPRGSRGQIGWLDRRNSLAAASA